MCKALGSTPTSSTTKGKQTNIHVPSPLQTRRYGGVESVGDRKETETKRGRKPEVPKRWGIFRVSVCFPWLNSSKSSMVFSIQLLGVSLASS